MKIITKLVKKSKQESKEYFRKKCEKKIEQYEKKKMRRKRIRCPNCESDEPYRKRGKRERKLRTSEGEIEFKMQQVECKKCKKVYKPLTHWLGLKPRMRITEEYLDKAIKTAIHTSYKVASQISQEFTGEKISGRSIQKGMLSKAEEIRREKESAPPETYTVMLKDSTKGKTGKTQRGEDINITYGIKGKVMNVDKKTGEIKRSRLIGDILSVSVGNDTPFKKIQHQTENVMTDGDPGIKNKVKHLKESEGITFHRCTWHLSRMLGFALYHDGLKTKKERKIYVHSLASIIKYSHNNYRKYYQELMEKCEKRGLKKAVTYLKNAQQEFFNTKEKTVRIDTWLPDGTPIKPTALLANSPIERVMREVDRRADIGVRWSQKGLQAITTVRLHFLYQFNSLKSILPLPSKKCYV